jgi:hypothetical protein
MAAAVSVAIRERIEARAEDDVLRGAALDGAGEVILREPAAGREEGAQRPGDWMAFARIILQGIDFSDAGDPRRQRIVE